MPGNNVDYTSLTLRRHGVDVYPPGPQGAAMSDNPANEVWVLMPEVATKVFEEAEQAAVAPEDVVRTAFRGYYHLDEKVAADPFSIRMLGEQAHILISRDHEMIQMCKSIAQATGETSSIGLLHEILGAYFEGVVRRPVA